MGAGLEPDLPARDRRDSGGLANADDLSLALSGLGSPSDADGKAGGNRPDTSCKRHPGEEGGRQGRQGRLLQVGGFLEEQLHMPQPPGQD